MRYLSILLLFILLFLSCNEEENSAPLINVKNIIENEEIPQGETVSIHIESNDNDGEIIELNLFVNDDNVKTVEESSSMVFEWNTSDYQLGNHSLLITAIDNSGNEGVKSLSVSIIGNSPGADFIVSADTVIADNPVTFTDISSREPQSWLWDFGDGNTSDEQNPEHIYTTPGNYTVKLTVQNSYGSKTVAKSNCVTVSKYSQVSDIEGNVYKTVKIGTQWWMAENLNTETFNDGTAIFYEKKLSPWQYTTNPRVTWFNGDKNTAESEDKGGLYNAYTVLSGNVCPSGWHVPSDEDWMVLERQIGLTEQEILTEFEHRGSANQGNKLKSTDGWLHSQGTNETGFTAVGAGGGNLTLGSYVEDKKTAYFWTSTKAGNEETIGRGLSTDHGKIFRAPALNYWAFSIRCVKD